MDTQVEQQSPLSTLILGPSPWKGEGGKTSRLLLLPSREKIEMMVEALIFWSGYRAHVHRSNLGDASIAEAKQGTTHIPAERLSRAKPTDNLYYKPEDVICLYPDAKISYNLAINSAPWLTNWPDMPYNRTIA